MGKRERGALRADVLRLLWASGEPLTANALREAFPDDERPALTTLLTVLSRLEAEDLVRREQHGRGSVFSAARPQAAHFADRMTEVLGAAADRRAVLQEFAGGLSEHDLQALRDALDD